jgi:3-oxoacyl-[acyl-carrier protein] reductase
MNLNIKGRSYLICGATAGFGRATLEALYEEDANVYAVARTQKALDELKEIYPKINTFCGDVTHTDFIDNLLSKIDVENLNGVLVNAGGPPAMKFEETKIDDWDKAYNQIVRWKVYLTQELVKRTRAAGRMKFVYVESASVKQPIENLILSTSLRLSIVGMVKTISQELATSGLRFNVLGPGYHGTAAVDRLISKRAENESISFAEAKNQIESNLPMGIMGDANDFGKIAAFLFSDYANYMNGLVIPVDGGFLKSTL